MQNLPAPTTIVYPGSPEQFGNVVHTALRRLYRQDTERLAQEFELDVELVAKMRQRNLDRLGKEAGLSPKTIARLKAAHQASISAGLDFYPTTQLLAEDYSFVLDENQVGRKAIINALLAVQNYDLNAEKDEARFLREIWPLLKFVNEKKVQLSYALQTLSSDNLYIRRALWRCTLAYGEHFSHTAAIEAVPTLHHLGYSLVYFQDGFNAARQSPSEPLGEKFQTIITAIIEAAGLPQEPIPPLAPLTQTTAAESSTSKKKLERPGRRVDAKKLNYCKQAMKHWLDNRLTIDAAIDLIEPDENEDPEDGGRLIDPKTLKNRIYDVLTMVNRETSIRWRSRLVELGYDENSFPPL